jgi:hypothetical protein
MVVSYARRKFAKDLPLAVPPPDVDDEDVVLVLPPPPHADAINARPTAKAAAISSDFH